MSIEDIINEAKKAKLNPNEIETAKRQYYFGILQYEERHPQPNFHKFRSAIQSIIHHRNMSEYCGEAYARKYIRETSSRTSHDNERSIQETSETYKRTQETNKTMENNGDNQ